MLDIGCGDGLLLQRLAPFAEHAVGIDPDTDTISTVQARLASLDIVSLVTGDFLANPLPNPEECYSTVICEA